MKVLGLDLSSNTGFALLSEQGLISYGNVTADGVIREHRLPEYNSIYVAKAIANRLARVIIKEKPDLVIIEQTNLGRARDSQKVLEFIHFAVLEMLETLNLDSVSHYVDTSAWRGALEIKLSKEQRKHNSELSKKKRSIVAAGNKVSNKKGEGKITWKHLSVEWANKNFNLGLILKDNDIADAIALAKYGLLKQTSINKNKVEAVDMSVFSNKS